MRLHRAMGAALLSLLLALAYLATPPFVARLQAALADNLIVYYSLDEANGNAIDAHSTHDLTETNGVAATAGKVSGGRDFELDTAEYFTVASFTEVEFGDTDFSVCAWVNLETTGALQIVVGKDIDTPANNRDFGLTVQASNVPQFYIDGGNVIANWGSGLSGATWYFLCGGYIGSSNTAWVAVDAGTPVTATGSAMVSGTSSPLRIGARAYAGFANYFDGIIDEVGIWGRDVRSDVASLYNSGSGVSYATITGAGAVTPRGMLTGILP